MEQQCPTCGASFPSGEVPPQCPTCGAELQPEAGEGIAFDDPRRYGFATALWQTWREATLFPNLFYVRIPTSGVVLWPFIYALLFWWVYVLANAFIQQPVVRAMMAASQSPLRNRLEALQTSPEMILFQLLFLPFLLVPIILLASAAFHGLLYLVNGARPEYTVTLRTVCYTAGASVAYLLPGVGPFIHVIWVLVLLISGLARAHQTENWRGAFAVLLPAIACCGVAIVLTMYMMASFLRVMK